MADVVMENSEFGGRTGLKALMEDYERSLIMDALQASGGHQRRTAARLGILPTTLHEKMKRLGLLRPRRQEALTVPGLGALIRPAAMVASPYVGRR
jgi:DNA-binding NtrC family response regulator